MPAIQRIGDVNTGDGAVINASQSTVFANNLLVAVDGSPVEPHGTHGGIVTANGSPNVFINFIPVNRIGDADTCGHTRATGSPNVFINS